MVLCQQGVAITTGDEDPDAAADLAPYAGPLDAFFSSGPKAGSPHSTSRASSCRTVYPSGQVAGMTAHRCM